MRIFSLSLSFFAVLLLAACGFQLRQAQPMHFDTLHITPATDSIALALSRRIGEHGVEHITAPHTADMQLDILANHRNREILSLSSAGKVSEYQITQTLQITLHNRAGEVRIAPATLSATREYTYDDAVLLAKHEEENMLWKDIEKDLVEQIISRLQAVRP